MARLHWRFFSAISAAISSSLHREIAIEITAKIAGVNGPLDRGSQTLFGLDFHALPVSLNCF